MLDSEHHPDLSGMPAPKIIEASGTSFPFVEAGSGAPILFVHGAWADLRIWCGLWEEVARHHQFLAFTQRHFGYGAWPDTKPFSREVHTDDLLVLIRSIGKSVHLVGWSYAGGILLRVAAEVPGLVRSLTIYEPSFESEAAPKEELLRRAREVFWNELEPAYSIAQAGDLDTAMRRGAEIVFGLEHGGFGSLDPKFQRVFLDNAHRMIPELEAPESKTLKETELRAVNCPALIVSGDRTHEQYRLMVDATLDSLPNASAMVYEGVGHGGPVQVSNQFARTILDFVKGVST